MRTKQNYRLLARLNRKAVFVSFEDASWHNEPCDSAEAIYFGTLINLSFPNSSKSDLEEKFNTFELRLYELDDYGSHAAETHFKIVGEYHSLAEAVIAINAYIRSRPFTIYRQSRGKYQLLDPQGFDYSGEYISLADAKRTCGYNYLIK